MPPFSRCHYRLVAQVEPWKLSCLPIRRLAGRRPGVGRTRLHRRPACPWPRAPSAAHHRPRHTQTTRITASRGQAFAGTGSVPLHSLALTGHGMMRRIANVACSFAETAVAAPWCRSLWRGIGASCRGVSRGGAFPEAAYPPRRRPQAAVDSSVRPRFTSPGRYAACPGPQRRQMAPRTAWSPPRKSAGTSARGG